MSARTLPREIADGVHWLSTCLEVGPSRARVHAHNSAFLVLGDTGALLIDTGIASGWPELSDQLEVALAGRDLTHVLPTHPELPHAGNLGPIAARWSTARVVGNVDDYALFWPDLAGRLDPVRAGESIDLGGRRLTLTDAPVRDLPHTLWGWDGDTATLFSSDAFAYSHDHLGGQCAATSEELAPGPTEDDAGFVIAQALHWPRYVDPALARERLARHLEDHPARVIAPAHGGVVTEPGRLRSIYDRALERAYAGD